MSVATAVTQRLPLPPFTLETAIQKVRVIEDAWNSRDPEKMVFLLTPQTRAGETAPNSRTEDNKFSNS